MKNAFSLRINDVVINFESLDEIKNKKEYCNKDVELLFDGKKVFAGKFEDCINLLEYYKSYEEGQKVIDVICDLKDELSISEYKFKMDIFRSIVFLIATVISICTGNLIVSLILGSFTTLLGAFTLKRFIKDNDIKKELLCRSKILADIKNNTKRFRDKVKANEEKEKTSRDVDKVKNITYVNVDGLNESKVYYKKF